MTSETADLRAQRTHGYETERPDVQRHVPVDARSILDLGCSNGALGAALRTRNRATVVGVELLEEYAARARPRLDRVIVADVESFLRDEAPPEAPFDCVVCADVLEHLVDPWDALRRATQLVRPGGTVVVSLPNVGRITALLRVLVGGRWPRDPEGPFDATHLRWFTRADAVELLEQAGVRVECVEPRYWAEGRRLTALRLFDRLGLDRLVAVQYVLSGRRAG